MRFMKPLNFKEKLERVKRESDKDACRYAEIHPLAAQYHRGYRDALEWVMEEIKKIGES